MRTILEEPSGSTGLSAISRHDEARIRTAQTALRSRRSLRHHRRDLQRRIRSWKPLGRNRLESVCHARFDMVLMEQVLFNLFDNAANTHRKVPASRSRKHEMIPSSSGARRRRAFPRLISSGSSTSSSGSPSDRQRAARVRPCNLPDSSKPWELDCSRQSDRPDRPVFTIRLPVPVTSNSSRGHIMTPRAARFVFSSSMTSGNPSLFACSRRASYIVATAADAHTALDMVRSTRPICGPRPWAARHGCLDVVSQSGTRENFHHHSVKP